MSPSRGQFKYRCADCGADSWHRQKELIRASGARCAGCGSRRIAPVTEDARERLRRGQEARDEQAAQLEQKRGAQRRDGKGAG